jgi:phage shock protein PspC (stress-responsive transcriptional regulator)
MNKTIIININGIIFHIEEDAYEVLQTYMTAVKKHFGYSTDSNEIVGDIENRIAEMFSERINAQKAVITMEDVNEVTAQMGTISDFEDYDEDATDAAYQDQLYTESRGFFRDPDDKVIGGVCSGLGHYFDLDAKWLRLIFVIMFLAAGSGILLYIVLWILVPLARTRADKMSMRGEAPNLQNFKRKFDEEMGGIRENFSVAGQRISPGLKNTARKTGDAVGRAANVIIKIVGIFVIIGSVMGLIGSSVALAFFLSGSENFFLDGFPPARFVDPSYYTPFVWSVYLASIIPLIALIMVSVRMISNVKISKYLGYALLIIWLTSLGFLIYYGSVISMDHAVDGAVVEEVDLTPMPVYHLAMNDVRTTMRVSDSVTGAGQRISKKVRVSKNSGFLDIRPDIYIRKAVVGSIPMMITRFSAEGRNYEMATERAQHIQYKAVQDSNRIVFDSHAFMGEADLYRDQDVDIELNIPVGTRLLIDNDVLYRLSNVSMDAFYEDLDDYNDRPAQTEWVMTENGLEYIPSRIRPVAPEVPPVPQAPQTPGAATDTAIVKRDSLL